MRYLHPVAASEKFIARGVYRFYEGDTLLPETQAWTRHQVAGGGILTRVDHTGFAESQYTTLVEVLTDETGRIERFNLRQWPSANVSVRTLRVDYVFFPEYVQASQRINEEDTLHVELPLPAPHVVLEWSNLSPLSWGDRIRYTLEKSEDVTVFYLLWGSEKFPGRVRLNSPLTIENREEQVSSNEKEPPPIKYYLKGGDFVLIDTHYIPLSTEDALSTRTILTEYAHI
jgi:hypothetical protein